MLSDRAMLYSANTCEAALQIAQENNPDIYIVSAEWLQEFSNEILSKLKSLNNNALAPYIILYGNCGAEYKLEGFEAGVDEFLPNPFNLIELDSRLSSLAQLNRQTQYAQEQANIARQTAFDAMEASSELGAVMRYTDTINGVDSFFELGEALTTATNAIDLKCSYQFRDNADTFTQGNPLGSYDERILTELKKRGNIVDFGRRSLFNQENVSILVKNMPEPGSNKYGRIKDNLQVICKATENKVQLINKQSELKQQQTSNTQLAIKESCIQLNLVSNEFEKLEFSIDDTMNWLKAELDQKLIGLALSHEQERAIMDMIDDAIERLGISYNIGVEIDNHLSRTKAILNKLL